MRKRLFSAAIFAAAAAMTLTTGRSRAEAPNAAPTPAPKSEAADDSKSAAPTTSDEVAGWVSIMGMMLFCIVMFKKTNQALDGTEWRLSDALSEEKSPPTTPAPTQAAGGAAAPAAPPAIAPAVLAASSSRLIAFMGAVVLLAVFFSGGIYVVYALFMNKPLGSVQTLGSYMLTGSSLFAPYAVNKISAAIK